MTTNTVYQIAGHEFVQDLVFGWTADGCPIYQLPLDEIEQVIEIAASNPILLGELRDAAVKHKEQLLTESKVEVVPCVVREVSPREKSIEHNVKLILNMGPDGTLDGEKYFFVSKDSQDLYTITGHSGRVRSSGRSLRDTAEHLLSNW